MTRTFLLIPIFIPWAAPGGQTTAVAQDHEARITIDVDRPGARVSPLLWGIFFEDINCSADGGIYAELVRNRSYEDADTPVHWSLATGSGKAGMVVDAEDPVSRKNPHSLKVTIANPGDGRVAVVNDGFWGMALKRGETYDLSFFAKGLAGFTGPLVVTLESRKGAVYARQKVDGLEESWQSHALALTASETDPKARLVISTSRAGSFRLDMVSLFPRKTWKGRPRYLRPDLAEMLAGLKPAFVRFPGGCWVEGNTMDLAYRWKQTIGDISERRTQFNLWNYHATHGLGFHEYLLMCEDLGAEPLFVINCGMSHRETVPMAHMDEYVQDALDAIEYCNGPADSRWGAVRAAAGHPEPFHLKYLEIGNENGGPAYQERYALFHDAIKAKYPEITLIADVPTDQRKAELIDEHYYNRPEFFIQRANRYDGYRRNGTRIYVGEYAVTQGCGKGNLRGAVGEAAFMTGMERNADLVVMSSYAPLFVNVNHRGWNPDLINFDSSRVYGIPSYYVQKMFSLHRGDVVLPVTVEAPVMTDKPGGGAVGVGTWLTRAEFKDIRVTRGDETLYSCDLASGTQGWRFLGGHWSVRDGALQQTADGENVRAVVGDRDWNDYTYSLKARKLGGREGFLILFRVRNEHAKSWWNLGGWGNVRHALEVQGISDEGVPGRIETGKWYDIRIELKGTNIKCYLDGRLVHDVNYEPMNALHASATRDQATGDVIVKVVNVAEKPLDIAIRLNGVTQLGDLARAEVLTADDPMAENTLEEPTRVAPVRKEMPVRQNAIREVFPANSVTVLRIQAR